MVVAVLKVKGEIIEEWYGNWKDFNDNSIFLAKKYKCGYEVVDVKEVK